MFLGNREWAHAEPLGELGGEHRGVGGRARDCARRSGRVGLSVGEGLQRVQRESAGAGGDRCGEVVEGRRAARVADELGPRLRGRGDPACRLDLAVGHAEEDDVGSGRGRGGVLAAGDGDVEARGLGG